MQNQILQQSFLESNAQANNISYMYLAKNRDMVNGLVDALKSIGSAMYNSSVGINSQNYASNVL